MDASHQDYVAGFRARVAANQAASQARTLAARTLLPKAADLLREGFGATRVGAFGSLVTTTGLAPGSDIDLYVDAVTRGRYWQAVAQLARLFGRPVDLVELAHAPSELLATIAEDGVDVP